MLITKDLDEAAVCSSIAVNEVPDPPAKRIRSTIVNADEILNSVNRGGLAHPTEISLTICALAFCFFQQVKDDDDKLTKFLTTNNQREVFINNIQDIVKNDASFNCLLKIKCSHSHFIFIPLVKTIFNCCAQILRKTLCTREIVDLDFPGDRGNTCNLSQKKKLRKLTSKTSIEK